MADAYRAEVLRPKYLEEATSMGAAVIAGVGCGLFPDFSAASRFIEITERTRPNPANAPVYDMLRKLMDECYAALEPIFPKLGVRA
jgi:xylulokinase